MQLHLMSACAWDPFEETHHPSAAEEGNTRLQGTLLQLGLPLLPLVIGASLMEPLGETTLALLPTTSHLVMLACQTSTGCNKISDGLELGFFPRPKVLLVSPFHLSLAAIFCGLHQQLSKLQSAIPNLSPKQ